MKILTRMALCLMCVSAHGADGDLPTSVGQPLMAANDSELTTALAVSAPGQHIILTGSIYSSSRTLGAGKVIASMNLASMPVVSGVYTLSGPDSIVHGLEFFQHGRVIMQGDRAQVTRCLFQRQVDVPINLQGGSDSVIARNEIHSWGLNGDCNARKGIAVRAPYPNGLDGAKRPRISYNYIHDQLGHNPESCITDAEVINLGTTGSGQRSQSRLEAWVHHNLIVDCAGDSEGFGIKSSYNRIEFNHLKRVPGFNNRLGGHNDYIGNRLESLIGSGMRINRGGYHNRSIGEVIDGKIRVEGGDYSWGDTHSLYMRSDSTRIIGSHATAFVIGDDVWNSWSLNAIDTLIQATNVAPILGSEQSNTTNQWQGAPSVPVPAAVSLSPSDVGPLSGQPAGGGLQVTGTIDFGSVATGGFAEQAFEVDNDGDATLSGTVSASPPFHVVAGGTFTNLATGSSITATVRFSPTSPAPQAGTITVSTTSGKNAEIAVSGLGVATQDFLTFDAMAGTILGPFTTSDSSISQPDHTPNGGGGTAIYAVTIHTPGAYKITAEVNAPNDSNNSFYVQFDAAPRHPEDIWDIIELTDGFKTRDVSARGGGTFDVPEFAPATWNLSKGTHLLHIGGREKNTRLRSITVAPVNSTPAPPTGLTIEHP